MVEKTLRGFDGLCMERKSYDVFKSDSDLVNSTKIVTERLLENIEYRYNGGERWGEMDEYWARENAAFLVTDKPYHGYLPGRYFTYDSIADIIVDCIGDVKKAETVEIGCGSGICLVIQARKGVDKVHGFDKSYGALSFFEDLANHYKVKKRIAVKQGDFYSTGYDNNRFDATFNVGVFEHLSKNDQRRLIDEMSRITKPGGVILAGIPNPKSPLNRFSKDKELKFYEKLLSYIFPLRQHQYSVDLRSLFDEAGIEPITESATLIAPPSAIPLSYFDSEDIDIYGRIPKMGRPAKIEELMKFWRIMEESVATKDELMKVGWYKYIVGRKPSK